MWNESWPYANMVRPFESSHYPDRGCLTPSALLAAATHIAGQCEAIRLLPVSVTICGEKANMAQFLGLTLQYLAYGKVVEAVGGLTPPETLYPALSVPGLIEVPIARDAYLLNLCAPLYEQLKETDHQPAVYHVTEGANEQGELRFSEAVYWVACILRGLAWFGDLPQLLHRNIVSPAGLVPWEVPAELSHYLTALEGSDLTGTSIPANRPDVFNFAQTVRGKSSDPNDPYDVASSVYKFGDWNGETVSYYLGGCQFEGPYGSTWDRVRFFRFNSVTPKFICALLLRSLGIPTSSNGAVWVSPPYRPQGYPDDCGGWCNVDSHEPFGVSIHQNVKLKGIEECSEPGAGVEVAPAAGDAWSVVVGSYRSTPKEVPMERPLRLLFVSSWDVATIGPVEVAKALVAGRFDAVVLTVIDADGWIYFPGSGESGDEHPWLAGEAQKLAKGVRGAGLGLWVSVSTCANERRRKAWPALKMKYGAAMDQSSGYQPPQWMDPCADKYWDWLGDRVLQASRVLQPDGIVFTHHYHPNLNGDAHRKVGWWDNGPSYYCQPWEPWSGAVATSLLTDRLNVLVGVAARGGVRRSALCSFPVQGDGGNWPVLPVTSWADVEGMTTYNPNFEKPVVKHFGYQDVPVLQTVVDDVIYVISGSKWLSAGAPVWSRVVEDHAALTGRRAFISLELLDDWRADPVLWRGVYRKLSSMGAGGVAFHAMAISSASSGLLGRAYTDTGWATLSRSGTP